MGQLGQLSDSLERARSQYDAANTKLAQIQRDLRENSRELRVAKHNLKVGQRTIAQRLVALYTSDQESTLEVVLGANSLDDIVTRIDNARSVTQADTDVLAEVKHFRAAVKHSGDVLKHAHQQQAQVVAERAAAKRDIETKIAQQQRLYSSLRGEIAKLVEEQAAHQRALAAAARERLHELHASAIQQASSTVVGASAITPSSDTVVAPPPTHGDVVQYAMSQLNTPYVWGGGAPGGFDCSGLVMWAYAQYGYGVPVSRDQLQPGDLVFFDGLGHVGIYIGGDQFVHAPHTGDVVKISSLSESWYAATFVGARRIL